MKNPLLSSICFVVLLTTITVAQNSPLRNQDVIDMSAAGLAPVIIISKIKSSKVDFKTETADLQALGNAKVANDVIAAMIERQASLTDEAKPEVVFGSDNAESGDLSEIKGKTKVFLVCEDSVSREAIVKSLSQKLPQLAIVDSRSSADFGMMFRLWREDMGSSSLLGTAHNVIVFGQMNVYTYLPVRDGDTKGRIRMLWQKRKKQDFSGGMTFNRHPATNAVNSFIGDFKKLK